MKVWKIFDTFMTVVVSLLLGIGCGGGLIFLIILVMGGFNK